MNFDIGSAFSKGSGSAFSEGPGPGPGPLYKVCPPEQAVELNTFNEVDMTPRQPEGIDTADEGLATSPQQQHCNLLGAGNKDDCFIFDLLKSRITQPEKEIYRKDEIISFLTEQLSVRNINTSIISSNSLHNQSQERRSLNNSPLNDSIESGVPREEVHIVKKKCCCNGLLPFQRN